MMDLLKFISVFFIFGFIPLYSVLRFFKINSKTSAVLSIGYTPIIIALVNIIIVFFNLQNTSLPVTTVVLLDLLIIYYVYFKNKIKLIENKDSFINVVNCAFVGIVFGLFYWFICFSFYQLNGHFYEDTLWNFGVISELKNHFPPVDPHWYTSETFKYHYLTDLYYAGISNISKLSVIQSSARSGYLVTSLCTFVIISMFSSNYKDSIRNGIIFLIVIMVNFTDGWEPLLCLALHLSGQAASTYYWALPIFLSNVYLWFLLDSWRYKIIKDETITYKDNFKIMLIVLIQVTAIIFSKGSYTLPFVLLEFFSFIRAFMTNEFWDIRKIKVNIVKILPFSYWPVFVFMIAFLFFNQSTKLFFLGIEPNDFVIFKSWNPLYPFIAVYGLVLTYLLINFKSLRETDTSVFFVLLASVIQFIFFLIFKGIGQADLYFIFNAIIFLALFLMLFIDVNKLLNIQISYIILSILLFIGIRFFNINGFSLYPVGKYIKAANDKRFHVNIFQTNFISDLELFKSCLPLNAIIVVPNMGSKFFLFSAFMERRIWNESPSYSMGTRSEYAIAKIFMKQENIIPKYVNKTPDLLLRDNEYKAYRPNAITKKEYIELEDPSYRYNLYQLCAFAGKSSISDCEKIKDENKWTHLIISKTETDKISPWLKTKKKYEGQGLIMFKL